MGDAKAQAPKVMMAETIEMLVQRATFFDNPCFESADSTGELFVGFALVINAAHPC
jgi:hypothetical protein